MLFLSTTTELLCIHQQPKKYTTLNQTFFIFIPQQYTFKFCFLFISEMNLPELLYCSDAPQKGMNIMKNIQKT